MILDNLAVVIGYIVLGAASLFLARYFISFVIPGMFQTFGIQGFFMMGVFFLGWGIMLYLLANTDKYSYSSIEVVMPPVVSTLIYLVWLARWKPKPKRN
jgi:hypothetical protein